MDNIIFKYFPNYIFCLNISKIFLLWFLCYFSGWERSSLGTYCLSFQKETNVAEVFLAVHPGKDSLYGITKVSIYFIAILDIYTQLKWNQNVQVCLKEVYVNNA